MKKRTLRITALLLALLFALPLVSCGKDKDDSDTPQPLAAYTNALSETPKSAAATSMMTTSLGRLEATYAATYNDGAISVSFTRLTFGKIDSSTTEDELTETVTGTAQIGADGSSGGKIGALMTALLTRRLSLDKITEYEDKDGTLSFTVNASDSEYVFGGECEYDVAVTITLKDGKIEKISLSYESGSGTVNAECIYAY